MKKHLKQLVSLLLAFALLLSLAACSNGASATTMHLKHTEGTVAVSDEAGEAVELLENLGLYSGYGVGTRSESYAWINLDDVKLTKMDQDSEIAIQKEGKRLEIEVKSGALFFNVTEPLAEDESMDIRTSTMVVGIRGTCGWVEVPDAEHMNLYLLEGTVECSVGDKAVTVHAGETAAMTADGEITVTAFVSRNIPAFVWAELEQDDELAQAILDASGIDVLDPPDTAELSKGAYEDVLERYRDAVLNALPYDEYAEDWEQMSRNHEINQSNYPDLGPAFLDYCTSDNRENPIYYAYHDLDGNGTDELFIGVDWGYGGVMLLEIHAFNGTQAVKLSSPGFDPEFCVYFAALSGDGLLIDNRGNGGVTSGIVYRLADDGYSLEAVTDTGIPVNADASSLDLSAHGGYLDPQLEWTPLQEDVAPDPAVSDAPLPTDGDRIVLQGTIGTYTYNEVLALQGVSDPNAGYSDTSQTFRLIVLDTPQTVTAISGDGLDSYSREAQIINVSNARGLDQGDGQHLIFSIDPNATWWPSDTSLPLGEPRTEDIHVLGTAEQ